MALRVLHVAAEAFPLIKTGGLADVAAALPAAQRKLGADARLLIPGYPDVLAALASAGATVVVAQAIGASFGAANVRVLATQMPGSRVPLLIADAPWYFARSGNPYVGPDGLSWADNHQRFALFGWLAAQIAQGAVLADWAPDVVHAHDWHAALALAWLADHPASRVRRVFTIHNLAFQGRFSRESAAELPVSARWMRPDHYEFHGDFSFIKAGIQAAHQITTVSPTYAHEILTPAEGHGLDGLLRHRATSLSGILNGIDAQLWNPETDPLIDVRYGPDSLASKRAGKSKLRSALGLAQDAGPLLTIISRLTEQKGIDTFVHHIESLVRKGFQLAALGTGEPHLETALRAAARAHPASVHFAAAFDETIAHRFIAAADAIVVPSRFEPCGLTQFYGLRYGTVPVARRVGGLADTVKDIAESPGDGNGFLFDAPGQFGSVMQRVLTAWQDTQQWQRIMRNGMRHIPDWSGPAQAYLDTYRRGTTGPDALPS